MNNDLGHPNKETLKALKQTTFFDDKELSPLAKAVTEDNQIIKYGTDNSYPEKVLAAWNGGEKIKITCGLKPNGVMTCKCVSPCNGKKLGAIYIDEADFLPLYSQRAEAEREKRKTEILTDLYKTGRLDGLYFGRESKSKDNPIKHYIKSCLYKNFISLDESLIDDCYNEMFVHLWNKPAAQIVELYTNTPKKLIATALKIISLKCFAIDPRYNNPKHSLIQSLLHTSNRFNVSLQVTEVEGKMDSIDVLEMFGCGAHSNDYNRVILTDDSDEPSDFKKAYGIEIEELLSRLSNSQRKQFYKRLEKQPRGKVSESKKVINNHLDEVIRQIVETIPAPAKQKLPRLKFKSDEEIKEALRNG